MEDAREGDQATTSTSRAPNLIPPPLPSPPPPPAPSVSSGESSSNKKEDEAALLAELPTADVAVGERGDRGDGDHDDDDTAADGYRTPTSPRHRIPVPLECPPAPRKPPPCSSSSRRRRRKRWSKRKMRSGSSQAGDGGGDVEEVGLEVEVLSPAPAAKKARKENLSTLDDI